MVSHMKMIIFYILLSFFGIATISLCLDEPYSPARCKFECQQSSGSFTLSLASTNEFPDLFVLTIFAKPHDELKGVSAHDEAQSLTAFFSKLKASGFKFDQITALYLPKISTETKQRVSTAAHKSVKWQKRNQANSAAILGAILDESDAFAEIKKEVAAYGLAIRGYSAERIYVENNLPEKWATFIDLDKLQ
ncbi:MAG: hypothetical protein CJBNEKGG_04064 [Prosthecobacter sp.]|nr:hypothetical protein [Prosthecobacter sp.]